MSILKVLEISDIKEVNIYATGKIEPVILADDGITKEILTYQLRQRDKVRGRNIDEKLISNPVNGIKIILDKAYRAGNVR